MKFFVATLWLLVVALLFLSLSMAQMPCDSEYGQYCPDDTSWAVGKCLKRARDDASVAAVLPQECLNFLLVHESCEADINSHCVGKEFTNDLLPCLTEWTPPSSLSASCLESLPKKEEKKKKELSPEEQERAEKRKSIRNKAAKEVKKQQARQDKEKAEEEKKKSKTGSKSKGSKSKGKTETDSDDL